MDERTKLLAQTITKLFHRGARSNIQKVFQKTHPADIASVLQTFSAEDSLKLLNYTVGPEEQADIMSYFENERQIDLAKLMSKEQLLILAKHMESDDLADLLSDLDVEDSEHILSSMDAEDSEDVADLMTYPEDSAGGIMSSDYFEASDNFTVAQTIQSIQAEQDNNSILFYIYVVNENNQLVGVLSLKQLLLSSQNTKLKEIMIPDVISVKVDAQQEDVAKSVERYDFLSVPVVDGNNELVGVITVDDIIDVIREEAEEDLLSMNQAGLDSNATVLEQFFARAPWLLVSFFGGVFCFSVIQHYVKKLGIISDNSYILLLAMIPVILTLGTSAGNQAAVTIIAAMRAGRFVSGSALAHLKKEAVLALIFSLLFGALVYLIGYVIFEKQEIIPISLGVGLQILVSILLGSLIPFMIDKLKFNLTLFAVPLFTIIADVFALILLFGLF